LSVLSAGVASRVFENATPKATPRSARLVTIKKTSGPIARSR